MKGYRQKGREVERKADSDTSLNLISPNYCKTTLILKDKLRKFESELPVSKDLVGKALPRIGAYNRLDNKEQVVAIIDEVSLT